MLKGPQKIKAFIERLKMSQKSVKGPLRFIKNGHFPQNIVQRSASSGIWQQKLKSNFAQLVRQQKDAKVGKTMLQKNNPVVSNASHITPVIFGENEVSEKQTRMEPHFLYQL